MPQCEVCNHPKAFELMTKVFQGKLTYIVAAEQMQLPVPSVWNCFSKHWETVTEDENLAIRLKEAKDSGDFVSILRDSIDLFIKRLGEAKNLPVSSINEKAVTSLSSELRGIMRDVLQFEGKLNTGIMVQLNIVQLQMTKLTNWLMVELCDNDKKKLMEHLPEIITESATAVADKQER